MDCSPQDGPVRGLLHVGVVLLQTGGAASLERRPTPQWTSPTRAWLSAQWPPTAASGASSSSVLPGESAALAASGVQRASHSVVSTSHITLLHSLKVDTST